MDRYGVNSLIMEEESENEIDSDEREKVWAEKKLVLKAKSLER
jgi:hypothetical protein